EGEAPERLFLCFDGPQWVVLPLPPCGGYGAGGRGGGFPPQGVELVFDLGADDGEAFGCVQVVEVGDLVALRLEPCPAGVVVGEGRRDVGATDGERSSLGC
ncbi:hypothetical protein RZS08_67225, partial [Arthrospira platensis SPKY1]|nr:hypothetical protein [Arthrospira platensis SPKY1]